MPVFSGKCKSKARLDGKTAVITGCNTGIGKETVKDFVKRGCRVIMACRDVSKAEEAAKEIRKATEGVKNVGVIVILPLDLSSFASVRQCAAELLRTEKAINLLINNAGVMLCPKGLTVDGFETQFGTNHLGHFLFTLLLLPLIRKSTPARIVTVSSLAHEQGSKINFDDINSEKSYSPRLAYGQSKLANVLFSAELASRLNAAGIKDVHTYSLHPGVVSTDLGRHMDTALFSGAQWIYKNVASYVIKTAEQGAQTSIYCAVDEKAANETGLYYSDCQVKKASAKGRDSALAKRLWEESLKMTGLQNYDPFTAELSPEPVKQVESLVNTVKEHKDIAGRKDTEEASSSDKIISGVTLPVMQVQNEIEENKDVKVLSDLEVMGINTSMLESASTTHHNLVVNDVKEVVGNNETKEVSNSDVSVAEVSFNITKIDKEIKEIKEVKNSTVINDGDKDANISPVDGEKSTVTHIENEIKEIKEFKNVNDVKDATVIDKDKETDISHEDGEKSTVTHMEKEIKEIKVIKDVNDVNVFNDVKDD